MKHPETSHRRCGMSRRSFLAGTATGLGVALPSSWIALQNLQKSSRAPAGETLAHGAAAKSAQAELAKLGMPGPYPGKVVEIRHPQAVDWETKQIHEPTVSTMLDEGMKQLVGTSDPHESWGRFFAKDEVIGIKVNPVGRAPLPGESGRVPGAVGSISSPEVVAQIVERLSGARGSGKQKPHSGLGVPRQNIVLVERYADEFVSAGYHELVKPGGRLEGVRWLASSYQYTPTQVDIRGYDRRRIDVPSGLVEHVAGYDPDHFVHMSYCADEHDPKDDRRYRSHLSAIVTKHIDKLITIPCLKDHRSAGVTLSLKNLSHGFHNNVARSHLGKVEHGEHVYGPNQCNVFIPSVVAQLPMRLKATLHILDGLIGVYEGGPGCWNASWGTWPYRGLLFATDPVALDHIGWRIIDAQRRALGLAPVGMMGLLHHAHASHKIAGGFAAFGTQSPLAYASIAYAGQKTREALSSENFDRRQPEHIILANKLGLGVFERGHIDHRVTVLV